MQNNKNPAAAGSQHTTERLIHLLREDAQKNHAKAQKEGMTCIDCHKGIAHLLPKEYKCNDED